MIGTSCTHSPSSGTAMRLLAVPAPVHDEHRLLRDTARGCSTSAEMKPKRERRVLFMVHWPGSAKRMAGGLRGCTLPRTLRLGTAVIMFFAGCTTTNPSNQWALRYHKDGATTQQ